jgi:trafficking protein particle complex subunit 5
MGFDVGQRFLELTFAREKSGKRETKVVNLLQFISTNMWKTLFGKKADGVEKSKEHDNVCECVRLARGFSRGSVCAMPADMIRDNDPLTNRYISVPRDYAPLNCAAYIGGILRGALDAAGFVRCRHHFFRPLALFPSSHRSLLYDRRVV